MENYFLEFKYSQCYDRGVPYGNYCRAYLNGQLVGSCNGGGYDMRGTALAEWVNKEFKEKIKDIKDIYGLTDGHIDGASGLEQVFKVLNELGYQEKYVKSDAYLLERKDETFENLETQKDELIDWNKFSDVLVKLARNKDNTIKRHAEGLLKSLKL